MRLLVDLFACQTMSRFRGIGRYTLSLTREMANLRGMNDMFVLADNLYEKSFEELRQDFVRKLSVGAFLPYNHPPVKYDKPENVKLTGQIAATLVRQAYLTVSPDIVLTPSPFEGWLEQGIVPSPGDLNYSYAQAAILYDLIPFVFKENYLEQDLNYKQWYLERLNNLHKYDILLSISEATRQDAIKILGINPDKVINISGAAGSQFHRLDLTYDEKRSFLGHYGIHRPFILYIGEGDFRKNRDGALRAYAQLPRHIIESHQFVTSHSGDKTTLYNNLLSLGFVKDDVVVLGHLADEDLVKLYNLCKLFFFPSLYEGFGLPILEAMACGAPVITSNNSSLPEVVGRQDVLFDASNPQAMVEALHRALTNPAFLKDLADYGPKQADQFSWSDTAQRAWDAIEAVQETKKQFNHVMKLSSSMNAQPRMRIAYISPLPPQKSGIADYSAELLPHLVKHFDIDLFVQTDAKISDPFLHDNFRIFTWDKLLERRDDYATVVYQMGNSPFHTHMIELLREMPGVVVLHDFFLNNLAYAEEYILGKRGVFLRSINSSHGLRGMIDLVKFGVDFARLKWPVNWTTIKYAQELVVHSGYQNELIRQFYNPGWQPKPTIINPLRGTVPPIPLSTQKNIKREFGLDPDVFLFCSFGFLDPTKLNHLTLEAFAAMQANINKKVALVFVGELSHEEYSKELLELTENLGLKMHVKITGFVSRDDYDKYLSSADAAIQLRTNSRGETSAAVLDCLSRGIPVVVNSHGTLNDYSADDVLKLPDPPSINDLCQAMKTLIADDLSRMALARRGQEYITRMHNPEVVAAAYASVIHRAANMDERLLFVPIVNAALKKKKLDDLILKTAAKHAAANSSLRCHPRILLDVTDIAGEDWGGGIQRVVRSLVRELLTTTDQSVHIELIRADKGQISYAYRFAEMLLDLPQQSLGIEEIIDIWPGDILFMLDATWINYEQFLPVFEKVRKRGGKIMTMVYDLIPIRFPDSCAQVVKDAFEPWLRSAIKQSDHLVCISQSVADDLVEYVSEKDIRINRTLDVSFIHLGANIRNDSKNNNIRAEVHEVSGHLASLFLMIGTLEPRKGHAFTLDAFERLWSQGYNFRLCFAGKTGWDIEEVENRIRNHAELGKRLFFIEKPSDAEINYLYSAATALVTASKAEGFGLPIVEAALHHVPTIASDLPVFHEVGKTGALYFSLQSPAELANCVIAMSKLSIQERLKMADKVDILTWKESAEWLLKIVGGEQVHCRFSRLENF